MSFTCTKFHIDTIYRSKDMMILVNCGCCGVASGYGCAMWCTRGANGVQGTTVLYEGSDVRTVNGFVLPRDRSLEYASPKYRRRNSVIIIIASLATGGI